MILNETYVIARLRGNHIHYMVEHSSWVMLQIMRGLLDQR